MKKIFSFISILLLALSLTACGSHSIPKELGITGVKETIQFDTHGGSHGDGTTYMTIACSDDEVLKQIQNNSNWKAFPLDDTVKTLVYGISDASSSIGPFLTDEDGQAFVPKIQNGYYCLIDRQAQDGKATGADILHRSSFNFTLGLYDTDTNTLHICQLDT